MENKNTNTNVKTENTILEIAKTEKVVKQNATTFADLSKVEKFNAIKKMVEKNKDMVDFIDNEIAIIENKYANAKLNKAKKVAKEDKPLIDAMNVWLADKTKGYVFLNKDFSLKGYENISTSKKTRLITDLIAKGKVKRLNKKVDGKVQYEIV